MIRDRLFPRNVRINDDNCDPSNACIYGSSTSKCIYGGYWIYLLIQASLNSLWLYNDLVYMQRIYSNQTDPAQPKIDIINTDSNITWTQEKDAILKEGDWIFQKVTSGHPHEIVGLILDTLIFLCTVGCLFLILCQPMMYRGITYVFIFVNSFLIIIMSIIRFSCDHSKLTGVEFYWNIGVMMAQIAFLLVDFPLCWYSVGLPRFHHILNPDELDNPMHFVAMHFDDDEYRDINDDEPPRRGSYYARAHPSTRTEHAEDEVFITDDMISGTRRSVSSSIVHSTRRPSIAPPAPPQSDADSIVSV